MAEKFGFGGTSTKTRTLLLFGGAAVAVILGVVISKISGNAPSDANQKSTAVAVPQNIDTTPGKDVSERYRNLQVEENEKRAKNAEVSGKSAIPTVVGEVKKYDFDLPDFKMENIPGSLKQIAAKELPAAAPAAAPGTPFPNMTLPAATPLNMPTISPATNNAYNHTLEASNTLGAKEQNDLYQKMSAEAKQLSQQWAQIPKLSLSSGTADDSLPIPGMTKDAKGNISYNPDAVKGEKSEPTDTIKAGTIYFAVLDTAVNSDNPGPVLATVVDGPYKGARLIGKTEKISKDQVEADALQLTFSRISHKAFKDSITFDGVAIDPNTARTAMASEVDRHYLSRYGALFAASFMQGFGQAVSQQGSTTVSTADGTTTTQKPNLSGKEQMYSALGAVGQAWGSAVQSLTSRPYTIKVNSGESFGLLILSDFQMPQLPKDK